MRGTDVTERTEAEPTLLRVRELTKTFFSTEPPATVLNGIDLDVARGEFLAIMGASGSGKSTLLYAMSGMDRPTSGSVELDDREITSLDDAKSDRSVAYLVRSTWKEFPSWKIVLPRGSVRTSRPTAVESSGWARVKNAASTRPASVTASATDRYRRVASMMPGASSGVVGSDANTLS